MIQKMKIDNVCTRNEFKTHTFVEIDCCLSGVSPYLIDQAFRAELTKNEERVTSPTAKSF
jgi:hypothetical protein